MIVTVTPNPSIDATLTVDAIVRGEVARATSSQREAGGKGINVANVAHKAGRRTLAIAPCGPHDPFDVAVRSLGIGFAPVEVAGAVRTNTALTESDGTTTKINEQGPTLTPAHTGALESLLRDAAADADAVVLAGSLPPGAPRDWYARLVDIARSAAGSAIVAVDTSDDALVALGEVLPAGAPDVMKPNAFELAQLTGANGRELEEAAKRGEFAAVVDAAQELVAKGVAEVLVTLGGSGACLVTADGAWAATAPAVEVRSTVGAGDSSLAGYIMARADGDPFDECLRRAVAYGSAAAALPGTGLPSPADLDLSGTEVSRITR